MDLQSLKVINTRIIEYFTKTIEEFKFTDLILSSEYYVLFVWSLLCWIILFLIVHFFVQVNLERKKDVNDTKNRIISIIHASLIFWMALYDFVYNQSSKCGDTNNEFQNKLSLISSAYFLYDMIACIILDCSDKEMVIHHISCIAGYYFSMAYNNSCNEIVRALIVTEVTCPIMHLRMILKNYNLKHSKLYLLLDYIYMYCYLIARMGFGAQNAYFTVFCPKNLLVVKIAGGFLWIQSAAFSGRMIKLILVRGKEAKERKEKQVELFWFKHNKKVEELKYFQEGLKHKKAYIP
jgi:hypothetical protein